MTLQWVMMFNDVARDGHCKITMGDDVTIWTSIVIICHNE